MLKWFKLILWQRSCFWIDWETDKKITLGFSKKFGMDAKIFKRAKLNPFNKNPIKFPV